MDQQFSLRWNNYLNQITDAFGSLRNDEDLVDVTLSCEGRKIKAHKMLLSACSSYFRDIFKDNPCQHPVIVFRNVKFEDVQAIIDFMYQGEVNILQDQLESFLSTAEMMEVKGLTNDGSGREDENKEQKYKPPDETLDNEASMSYTPAPQRPDSPPTKKRKQSVTLPQQNKPQPVRTKAPPVREVPTPYVPVMVKEEVIEDLTIEDDEEDEPPIMDRLKSEHEFDAGSPELSVNSSMAPIDQMLAIEPGPSLEGVGQDMTGDVRNSKKTKAPIEVCGLERLNGKFHVPMLLAPGKDKDCAVCSSQKKGGQRKRTRMYCGTCEKKPGLHGGICFEKYHTLKRYKVNPEKPAVS